MTPQLILTLTPQGDLVAELPAANGARRQVPDSSLETIRRILTAQLRAETTIGLDGAPTSRQTIHWDKHSKLHPQPYCPWCREAGWTSPPVTKAKPQGRARHRTPPKTKHVCIPDPTGQSLLPIMVTKAEARKLGWRSKPTIIHIPFTPEDLGI